MFLSADIVQAIMVGLVFASLVTWTVWLAKSLELMVGTRRLRRALAAIGEERSLRRCARPRWDSARHPAGADRGGHASCACRRTSPTRAASRSASPRGLRRLEVAAGRGMTRGTGILATIGSTAPFVGLFGTVWGIMNSFIGISEAQTTNLAVVAPGIAEALLATAIGLVAAIPAVVIYNVRPLDRRLQGPAAGDASAELLRLVSRDLDRATIPDPLRKAAE